MQITSIAPKARQNTPANARAQNPIQGHPGTLVENQLGRLLPPLDKREAVLRRLNNPNQHIQTIREDLLGQLRSNAYSNEDRMTSMLPQICLFPAVLDTISTQGCPTILLASVCDREFFASIVQIYKELLEEDPAHASALCNVLLTPGQHGTCLATTIKNQNVELVKSLTSLYVSLKQAAMQYAQNEILQEKYTNLLAHLTRGAGLRGQAIPNRQDLTCSNYLEYAILKDQIHGHNAERFATILTNVLEMYYELGENVLIDAIREPKHSLFSVPSEIIPLIIDFVIAKRMGTEGAELAYRLCQNEHGDTPENRRAAGLARNDLSLYITNLESSPFVKNAQKR